MKSIKYQMTKLSIILAWLILPVFYSCSGKANHADNQEENKQHQASKMDAKKADDEHEHEHEHGHEHQDEEHDAHEMQGNRDEKDDHDNGEEEHGLHLSKAQMRTIGLELGALSNIKVNDFVKVTGTLGLPPNGYASVSAKATGIIHVTKKFVEGKAIKKGELIAALTNPDFIVKQQSYLEAKARLRLKELDLQRQEELMRAEAGVAKNLQAAQAEVAILEAQTMGLAKQLAYLGIDAKQLTPSTIRQQISVRAPISGYISRINMHDGMYTQPAVPLMEILSDHHIHLELDVFEKDIAKVKVGQKISYSLPALGEKLYQGEVSIIGKEFDPKTKTIRVHGHLEGERPIFLKDLFINGKIWLDNTTTPALPEEAILKDDAGYFIYVGAPDAKEEEYIFEKVYVIPGATSEGYTAVKLLDTIPEGKQIVTKGAYYVFAKSRAGELEHEH